MTNIITLHAVDPESRKKFGVFIGLFNKTNGTKLSVNQAMKIPELVRVFQLMDAGLIELGSKMYFTQSTRARAYELVNIPELDSQVLEDIKKNPGSFRKEVADRIGRRVSSVCGAVNRLIASGFLRVAGESFDPETGMTVETLEAV